MLEIILWRERYSGIKEICWNGDKIDNVLHLELDFSPSGSIVYVTRAFSNEKDILEGEFDAKVIIRKELPEDTERIEGL